MKKTYLTLLLAVIYSSIAFSGGEGDGGIAGGGSTGGGPKITRGIASVKEDDDIENEILKKSASKCLDSLNNEITKTAHNESKPSLETIKIEDKNLLRKMITEKVSKLNILGAKTNSAKFPECVYYANETEDAGLKNLFLKTPTVLGDREERAPTSNISK
jgi:hypothetical protein